jgi:hypothetical protein
MKMLLKHTLIPERSHIYQIEKEPRIWNLVS